MDFSVLVGTHHKTGTMWMFDIFQTFGERAGIPFLNFSEHCRRLGIAGDRCDQLLFGYGLAFDGIILADHAEGFATLSPLLPKTRARMFHVVRDPRDIAISAANYHLTSDEPWLHVPEVAFGGMTYQEKISSYDRFEDRILFEIEHSSASTVNEIRSLLDVDGVQVFKYEDLMRWPETFERMFDYCDFHDDFRQLFMQAVQERSFFGKADVRDNHHASDGRVEQWREKLDDTTRSAAERAFGDVIERLGYPQS